MKIPVAVSGGFMFCGVRTLLVQVKPAKMLPDFTMKLEPDAVNVHESAGLLLVSTLVSESAVKPGK
jgi:hypothetical protein